MKKNEWLEKLSLADKKYVDEADPALSHIKNTSPKRRIKWGKMTALAACFLAVVFTVTLFIPYNTNPPSVARYSGSEYYSIIEKLNAYNHEKDIPKAKNLFESIRNVLRNIGSKDANAEGAVNWATAEMMPPTDKDTYYETTDNQVAGVIEGDRIKRSEKYIYYIDGAVLYVYPITGKDESPVGKYDLAISGDDKTGLYMDESVTELYLSSDCKTVTVITALYGKLRSSVVMVRSLDVSDPENIIEKNAFTVDGSYNASRMVDGQLLLITSYWTRTSDIDFSDESTFLPTVSCGDGKELIPADCIFAPGKLDNTRYTVVTLLSEDGLEREGIAAFLSYSESIYVSEDDIFLTRGFTERSSGDEYLLSELKTEITRLSYKGSLENKGAVTVDGYINNQYDLDVYDGILRVVTTVEKQRWTERDDNIYHEVSGSFEVRNANLYCIDLDDLSIAAEVRSFAPEGETVRSVRFDGTDAYVCTSIQQTDPVFFFDLSDINNITVKDTGTIDGFSTSLINFGNGFLLGIGRGSISSTFKIEVYEEVGDGVRSVCGYEREMTEYSSDYKSYYIDRENGLVGLGLMSYKDSYNKIRYILLYFDGYKLHEVISCPLNGDVRDMRGVYIEGSFYMLGSDCMKVLPVFEN